MQEIMSTRQVAALLGVSVSKLTREVWLGRIKAPPKSPAGDHLWGRTDIEAAFALLARTFAAGGKLLVCGNCGSAADADPGDPR